MADNTIDNLPQTIIQNHMNKYILLLAIFCASLLVSCGGDEDNDEPTSKEVYECVITTPLDGTPSDIYFEEFSVAEFAKILPCDIQTSNGETTLCTGGDETTEYTLTLNKWKSASLTWTSELKKSYSVYPIEYTTYTFTAGEYSKDENGYSIVYLVKADGIYRIHPDTHEIIRDLIPLDNFNKVCITRADKPIRTYSESETDSYSKPFSLTKLAEDHFYIENADYTFECYLSAKGLHLTQIKPEEKETGLLYKD